MASIDYLPIAVAQAKGYFEKEGLTLNLQKFFSPNERDAALQSGALDGCVIDYTGAVIQSKGQKPLVLTSQFDGVFCTLIIGLPFGILLACQPKLYRITEPLLYLSYPIPKLALLPIIMILLGIGESAKVSMIVLILVFQIIISIRDAALRISK